MQTCTIVSVVTLRIIKPPCWRRSRGSFTNCQACSRSPGRTPRARALALLNSRALSPRKQGRREDACAWLPAEIKRTVPGDEFPPIPTRQGTEKLTSRLMGSHRPPNARASVRPPHLRVYLSNSALVLCSSAVSGLPVLAPAAEPSFWASPSTVWETGR